MSVLREGDEDMHYSDGSHRWIAPPGTEQGLWEVGVRAHLSRHMATMGGPVQEDRLWACRPAHRGTALEAAEPRSRTRTPATVEPRARTRKVQRADPLPIGSVSPLRSGPDEPVKRPETDPLPGAA